MHESSIRQIKAVGQLLFIAIVLVCLWTFVDTFIISQETGILNIKTVNSKEGLIISQNNSQAKFVGTGSAKIRLKPGSYQIMATYDGQQTSAIATVHKKQRTAINLGALRSVTLPTSQDINFEGTDALINNGLTTGQVTNLEEEFFHYKPSAHTVSIDTSTVEPGPHNPNVDTSFTINFDVAIDSSAYKATISYSNLDSVQLFLYNSKTDALVFNSGGD